MSGSLVDSGVRGEPARRGETGTSDPFLKRFLERVPPEVAASFTSAQLDAVKLVFSARDWGHHAVDLRRAFGAGRLRFYIVFLMGRARRNRDGRGPRLFAAMADWLCNLGAGLRRGSAAALVTVLVGLVVIGGLAALYAGKRALNINVVPGIDMLPDKELEGLAR